ncbi:hypothetical protein WA026_010244, partial [Henosepilachna vigintioctopunctata]
LAQEILAADAGVVHVLPSDLSCVQRGGESLHLISLTVGALFSYDSYLAADAGDHWLKRQS